MSITSSSPEAEAVDVLAVERRHERLVDPAHDRVGGLVGLVLGLAHPLGDGGVVRALGEHLGEQPGADDEVLGRLGEEVVERGVDRAEAESH